jgi:hypothetical protein
MEGKTKTMAAALESDARKFDKECREAALRGEWSYRGLHGLFVLLADLPRTNKTPKEMQVATAPLMPVIERALREADTIPRDQFGKLKAHPSLMELGYTGADLLEQLHMSGLGDSDIMYTWQNISRMVELVAKRLKQEEQGI